MAEKDLLMEFTTAGGGETSWTLDDVKQSLDKATLGAAMQAMCDANCFATSKGAAYEAPLSAVGLCLLSSGTPSALMHPRNSSRETST